jgi:hypothetical protein
LEALPSVDLGIDMPAELARDSLVATAAFTAGPVNDCRSCSHNSFTISDRLNMLPSIQQLRRLCDVRSATLEQADLAEEETVNINLIPHASAAVVYGGQLRLYITNGKSVPDIDSSQVVEQVFDGQGWSPGAFTASGYKVAATSWSTHIRVYVTVKRGFLKVGSDVFEYGFDGSGWYKSDLKWPGKATSAISWSDGQDHIRVYVVNEDELIEQCWDSASGWTVGTTWNYEP